jgi:hypothetical protein
MKRIDITEKLIYWSFLAIFVFALNGFGQVSTTGIITGTVSDATGAVVPDAEITINNQDTSVQTVKKTDGSGVFVVSQLIAGTYSITIKKTGFQTYSESGIILHPTQVATVNATMQVAQVGTNVNVVGQVAAEAQVQTTTSEISSEVSGAQAQILPLNGRNFESLAALMPGVVNLNPGTAQNDGSLSQSDAMSINGMGSTGALTTLDGIWNENSGNMSEMTVTPNPDTIDEVRVLQSNYSVRNSLMGSNVVIVATKSGTSSFHGSAFEYGRNTSLDANNFFANLAGQPRPVLQQNIFGYTLGGPFYVPNHYNTDKRKTFFFWSEQWIYRNFGSTVIGATPTAAMRAGQFSLAEMPNANPLINPATGVPIPNTGTAASPEYVLPASGPGSIQPGPLALMNAFYPMPNYVSGGFNNYINTSPLLNRQRDDEIKVDQNFTDKVRLMAEYLDEHETYDYPYQPWAYSPFNTVGQHAVAPDKLAQVELTVTITPSMINTTSVSLNHLINSTFTKGIAARSQLQGFNEVLPFNAGIGTNMLPTVSPAGGWSAAGPASSNTLPGDPLAPATDWELTYSDDLSWLRGNHYFDAGINVLRGGKAQKIFVDMNGSWGFSGDFSNNPIADFLTGYASSVSQAVPLYGRAYGHYTMISPYLQDQWKVTHRLTATLGLRATYFPPTYSPSGASTDFIPSLYNPARAPVVDPNGIIEIPNANANYNPVNGLGFSGLNGVPPGFADSHLWNLGPMVGLAWDVFGDGKTSVRAGYGITYTRAPFSTDCAYNCADNPPLVESISLSNLNFPAYNVGALSGVAAPTGTASLTGISPSWRPGEIQSYSLSVEHQIARDWLVSIAGAGNTARHMAVESNLNQVPAYTFNGVNYDFNPIFNCGNWAAATGCSVNPTAPPNSGPYVPYLGYSSITNIETAGNASYSALEVSVRHPAGHNLFLTANYTYSHSLSNTRGNNYFMGRSEVQDAHHQMNDYGSSNIDVPQVFAVSAIWTLPWFANAHGAKRSVLGGWRYSDVTDIQSGFATDPGESYPWSGLASRPNRVPGVSVAGPKNRMEWFNTAAFSQPAPGYFGNAAPGSIRGPGFIGFDMALYKDFKIYERHTIQFRTEAFNIFNHTNFSGVSTGIGAGGAGTITSARDPRVFEFALRYQF